MANPKGQAASRTQEPHAQSGTEALYLLPSSQGTDVGARVETGGQLQLLFGLRAGVGSCLLERVTEAQLKAAPLDRPAPGNPTATCPTCPESGNPGTETLTGRGAVGSSAGSLPPLSRNLEKVSRSLVLLYSIT